VIELPNRFPRCGVKLALKVIKLGMDTRAVISRFEAERQALALMDHPNIARVFGLAPFGPEHRHQAGHKAELSNELRRPILFDRAKIALASVRFVGRSFH
jgi:hypothetical protein